MRSTSCGVGFSAMWGQHAARSWISISPSAQRASSSLVSQQHSFDPLYGVRSHYRPAEMAPAGRHDLADVGFGQLPPQLVALQVRLSSMSLRMVSYSGSILRAADILFWYNEREPPHNSASPQNSMVFPW